MDSFIKEYEQGLRFRDNAIDNSSVDRMTLSKKYGEELVSSADRQILMVNKAAKERKVIIEDSGLLYQTDRVPLSKASKKLNVTKTESYWWGRINYLSYSNADKLRKDSIKFKTAAQVISEIAGIASFVKPNPPLGGFSLGNLAISHYCSYFAKRIKACNKKGKGIKYKIYWTMNYKMRTQGQSW